MPLILAFYCIVGGKERLPELRHQLYTKVLNRLLTGRWHDSYDPDLDLDVDACFETLRAWAWSGATNHPVSGVGMWKDDILPERPAEWRRLDEAEKDALDHVAPLAPAEDDTRKTLRRFIHRSIREHLVAGRHFDPSAGSLRLA